MTLKGVYDRRLLVVARRERRRENLKDSFEGQ
jgi:hypothetical protein